MDYFLKIVHVPSSKFNPIQLTPNVTVLWYVTYCNCVTYYALVVGMIDASTVHNKHISSIHVTFVLCMHHRLKVILCIFTIYSGTFIKGCSKNRTP